MILLETIGLVIVGSGLALIAISLVSCYILPDIMTKIHAASIIDSLALPASFTGLILLQNNIQSAAKLVFIIVLIYLLAPVSAHAIAQIYIKSKNEEDNAT